jgi:hypothetical protein
MTEQERHLKKGEVLELLFVETRMHVGTTPTPCVYNFQFDTIVDKIDKIYNPEVCLDKAD